MTKLPKIEVSFYFFSWVFGVLYSLYNVYLIGNKFSYLFEYDLVDGWPLLSRKKDNCDIEWKTWSEFILYELSFWILLNHIGARIFNYIKLEILPLWYFSVTSVCIAYLYGINAMLVFILQPIIFTIFVFISQSRILIWIFTYFCCHLFTQILVPLYAITSEDADMLVPTLMWLYLRCISFFMFARTKEITAALIYQFYGYVFHLPCFFLGPIILFDNFFIKWKNKKKNEFLPFKWLVLQNLRYFGWYLITEFLLHFIYVNCLQPYLKLLVYTKNENVWIMYGMGYAMGKLFYLKYLVVFGLAIVWTQAEGYKTPDPPKCIAHIHLYSQMWRHFDQGLYIFIKRYIFIPCSKRMHSKSTLKKIGIGFLCFVFVYVWHGLNNYTIFMWSLMNFISLTIESLVRNIGKSNKYHKFQKFIGSTVERRFVAAITCPLTILTTISNFYFIGDNDVAETYFDFIFIRASFFNSLCLWYFVYALCHVSMELDHLKKPESMEEIDLKK